jgi:hypothetical protein
MLYRHHRGSLDDSMATACEVTDFKHLVEIIHKDREGWSDQPEVTPETVRLEPLGYDKRIDWDTYIVTVNGNAVGYTNGDLKP